MREQRHSRRGSRREGFLKATRLQLARQIIVSPVSASIVLARLINNTVRSRAPKTLGPRGSRVLRQPQLHR